MIQLNMLPDVKVQYLKTQRTKHLVILGAFGAAAASATLIVVLCFVVFVWDHKTINDMTRDIKKYETQMGDITELEKALTVQFQLRSLEGLHNEKPVTSRATEILSKVVPSEASFNEIKIDTEKHTMVLKGEASNAERANTLADSFKFAHMTEEGVEGRKQPFSAVTLKSYNFDGKKAKFEVTLNYDEAIFDRTKNIVVAVEAGQNTTGSVLDRPNPLFIQSQESER